MEQSSLLGNVPRPPEPTTSPSAENPSRPANCCSNKAKIFLIVFLVTFVAAISSISAYFFAKSRVQTPVTSPTPIAQASPTPDETANWKTYTSNKIGYSLKAPPNWFAVQHEDDSLLASQDYLVNLTLSPESLGVTLNSVYIIFPVSIKGPHHDMGKLFEQGLEGLAGTDTTESPSHFSQQHSSYTTIAGKRALMTTKTWNINPPTGFAGSWCGGCTQKNYYIDLGNDKILEISGYWTREQQGFEKSLDQILSTFKFTDQNTDESSSLPTETLAYKSQADWQTYTDNITGFSFQYPPSVKFSNSPVEGKGVSFCNNNDVCFPSFSVSISNDYSGGSRREWLTKKFSVYKPYYMNWIIDKSNALVAIEGNPGGSNGLFIAIPNNDDMILFSASSVAWNPDTRKLPDLSFYKQILSTFKFTD